MSSWLNQPQMAVPDHVGESESVFGDETLDIKRYISALKSRWPLILACCVLATTIAFTRFSLTPKRYAATSIIQIERKRMIGVTSGSGVSGWLEDWWNMEYYPTQYRLLRTRGLAERVVLKLRLHEDPEFNSQSAHLLPDSDPVPDANIEIASIASRLRGGLVVRPIEDTQLVELTYQSTDPELAARIANGYADVYIAWGIEQRTSMVGSASSTLNAQMEELRQQIDERQRILNAYTTSTDFSLDPAGEALLKRRQTIETQYDTALTNRIRQQAIYREIINRRVDAPGDTNNIQGLNQLKTELFDLETDYESKLDTYTPEWPAMVDLAKEIETKKDQIDRLTQSTHAEAKAQAYADLKNAESLEASLKTELKRLASDARLQNAGALEYMNQLTSIETRKEILNELLKRQSEAEIASRVESVQQSNVRIVDRAVVPSQPFEPILGKDLIVAIFFGSALGIGLIVLFEILDRTIKSPSEAERILDLPTLAVVPDISARTSYSRYGKRGAYNYGYGYSYGYFQRNKQDRKRSSKINGSRDSSTKQQIELLPHIHPRLGVCEAYRSLRTALLLSSTKQLAMVAVTSAEPGEGKTATTTNLGVVMAQLGRRVLIIDGDLRRPRMHKVFKVSNRRGVVSYLTQGIELDSLVIGTEVPDLYLCPSGPIPPNPSELLASQRMRDLLETAKKSFDFVLIDTPPTLLVADAVLVGLQVDGVVLCIGAGSLLREDAASCREQLARSDVKTFGLVLNRFRADSSGYSKRSRYYGVYGEENLTADTSTAA